MLDRINYKNYNVLAALFIIFFAGCGTVWEIDNPYENVDWTNHKLYKGNFHTHTTRSDGSMNPQTVVDQYHGLGYDILAITDHNEVTYPWTIFSEMDASTLTHERMESRPESMPGDLVFEDREPDALGMIAVQGNELSRHHHLGSFFNDHNEAGYRQPVSATPTIEESMKATAAKNGITMVYHPGRYQERNPARYNTDWYIDLFQQFDHIIGLEIYNQGNKYPDDRKLWDSILTVTMPDRPVWGYSNDDMHSLPQLGRNWNTFILPELTQEWVRYGMENGLSYFVYAPGGHNGPEPPVIESININKKKGTIEINATDYEFIVWIHSGNVVHDGDVVDLNELPENVNYIRAKVYGAGEIVVGTQPFGIRRP